MTVANQWLDTEPAERRGLWASRAARGAAAIVAVGAAALSFRATSEVAESSGAVGHGYGWIVPLVVEAGVLTAAALAWVRSGEGLPARTETVVMAVLLALSVVVNIAHAAHGTLLGKVIAAAPPVVLLIAVEGLLREQRRTAAQRATQAVSYTDTHTVASQQSQPTEPPRPLPPATDPEPPAVYRRPAESPARQPETAPTADTITAQNNDVREPADKRGAHEQSTDTAEVPTKPTAEPASDLPPRAPVDHGSTQRRSHPTLSVVGAVPSSDRELHAKIRAAVSAGEVVTGAMVAGWLSVSHRTGSRRLKALTDADPTLLLQRAAK